MPRTAIIQVKQPCHHPLVPALVAEGLGFKVWAFAHHKAEAGRLQALLRPLESTAVLPSDELSPRNSLQRLLSKAEPVSQLGCQCPMKGASARKPWETGFLQLDGRSGGGWSNTITPKPRQAARGGPPVCAARSQMLSHFSAPPV